MKKAQQKVAVNVGLGLAAAAAAASAAGFYFFGSKDAEKNRKKVSKWAGDMKNDVVKNAKKLKKLDEKAYKAIVDESMKAYTSVKSIDKADLAAAAAELKKNWAHVKSEIVRVEKKGVKTSSAAVKKTVKKATSAVKKALPKKPAVKKSVTKAKKKN